MDYTKTKTFIAFINKDSKDRYWINGNLTTDKDEPRIYPYETKEEKELALYIGKNLGCWSECADVEAVLLKVQGSPFHIINKKEAKERLKVLEKEADERARKRKELEKKIQEEQEKFTKEANDLFKIIDSIGTIEKSYLETLKATDESKTVESAKQAPVQAEVSK